jgi:N-acetylmuramoyl-L-alanine amidase
LARHPHFESGKDLNFKRRLVRRSHIVVAAVLVAVGWLFWPARKLRSDNFVFYLPNARHVLTLEVIQDTKYLPLLPMLNLFGKVAGWQEKRDSVKVKFENTHLELHKDERKVRVEKTWINLSNPVQVSNGQWVVPVDFLTSALPRLTHQVVDYQVGTNRVFIGDVKPSSFAVRLDTISGGARLTVQFTDKITVRTASSNGKWIMFLGDRAFQPLESSFRFQNPYLSDLRFDDQDGVPKLILSPTSGGLNFYPSLAEGGKVLLADVLKPPPTVAQQPQPSGPGVGPGTALFPPPSPSGVTAEEPAAPPGPPLPVVALDAGHGADDAGARSRDGVLEKDLAAQLVARVRLALLNTRKYRIVLTRTGDSEVGFEQRATTANVAGAAYFLTFHAGELGANSPRVAVYTYMPPSPATLTSGEGPGLIFVDWSRVQEVHLDQSRQLATNLQQQLAQISGLTTDLPDSAPIRTLRSVNAPAVAIEIGSLSPDSDGAPLTDPTLQQRISTAITQALAAFEGKGA